MDDILDSTRRIRVLFRDWDPMGLIELGAPEDEYNTEADIIVNQFMEERNKNAKKLAGIIYEVMTSRLGLDPQDFSEECDIMANRLIKIIEPDIGTRSLDAYGGT
jgi:hypothetical protein